MFRSTSYSLSLTDHKAQTLAHDAEPVQLSTLSASSKNGRDLSLKIMNQGINNSKEKNKHVTTAQWHFREHHIQIQAAIKNTSTVPQDSNRSLEKRLAWGKKMGLLGDVVSSLCIEGILVFHSCLPQKKWFPSDVVLLEKNKEQALAASQETRVEPSQTRRLSVSEKKPFLQLS